MLKIGAVNYLNARPLTCGLDGQSDALAVTFDVPSRLADDLRYGRLDVALIPSIEYFRTRDYVIVPDACISSHGPVQSVILFSKVGFEDISVVALDESSRTSAALTQIILKERYALTPRFFPCRPEADLEDSGADAMLLIGDNAMRYTGAAQYRLDLGEEWDRLTGKPFVYAMWVTRRGVNLDVAGKRMAEAKERGLAGLDSIAERASRELGIERGICHHYLSSVMGYDLGPEEIEGLRTFYRYAVGHGLCEEGIDLEFYR